MPNEEDSTKKLPNYMVNPLSGDMGNTFSSTNQPDPALKKAGWEQWRKERLLTQEVIKKMLGIDGQPTQKMHTFINKLISNANKGNTKAIETISKCLEDEIIKVAQTNAAGEDAKTELSDNQFDKLLTAINASNNTG